jgi:anti-sigma factor RsiW
MPAVACPSVIELHQFVLGHNSDADFARIADHLEQCDTCVSLLRTLKQDDPLVQALRSGPVKDSEPASLV